jgi:biopolymer transport protein ExbB
MEWFQSSLSLISRGGIIMIPILICSIIALAIVIERLIEMKRLSEDADFLSTRIKKLLEQGNDKKALEVCGQTCGPISQIFKTGLLNKKNPRWKLEEKLSLTGQEQLQKLGKNIRGLEVIAAISPLMGLLGTVIGMVQAFNQVAEFKGQVNPSLLAGGIWEALLTTAAGLAVAIPVLVMLHYFERKIENAGFLMEKNAQSLVHFFDEKIPKEV